MQIQYCEGCKTKLTELSFDTGQAIWVSNQPFCKSCGDKVVQAKAPASRSGPRATPGPTRSTPGQTSRKSSTPGGTAMARRSGLNRAAPAEPAKSSGTHPRRSSPRGHGVTGTQQGPSMMMVSVIGAVIGVLLAVLVIMIFFR